MTSKKDPVKAIVVGAGGRGNVYAYYSIECPNKLQVRNTVKLDQSWFDLILILIPKDF